MNIASITVRRLHTGPGYNNVAHEMTVAINVGDDVDEIRKQADLQVQAWNSEQSVADLRLEYDHLNYQTAMLKRSKTELEADVERLRREIDRMRKSPIEQYIIQQNQQPF